MSHVMQSRLLTGTRWLVYALMGVVGAAGVILALVSVVLPLNWTQAVQELAQQKPAIRIGDLLPYLLTVFAFAIMVLGIVWTMMRKLLEIIGSVETGDPFIRANAIRLKAIGWLMIAVQIVGIPLAIAAGKLADLFGDSDTGLDLSISGILAILLVFILAGVFERGAEMREELEGTV
jgi:hypothetical protein